MLGFVSYRRSGSVRSLCNDRPLARARSTKPCACLVATDRAVCVLGHYVATELWLELGGYIATEPCACSIATQRPSLACAWSDYHTRACLWPVWILELVRGRFGYVSVALGQSVFGSIEIRTRFYRKALPYSTRTLKLDDHIHVEVSQRGLIFRSEIDTCPTDAISNDINNPASIDATTSPSIDATTSPSIENGRVSEQKEFDVCGNLFDGETTIWCQEIQIAQQMLLTAICKASSTPYCRDDRQRRRISKVKQNNYNKALSGRQHTIRVTDVPQSMDQSAQHEDQNIPDVPVEVHPSDLTRQTDRAVYRLDPRTSGLELRPDPRPDDRTDRTEARLYWPTRQAKADGQARINLGQANSDLDHGFSLLARLARTACTGDCADDLSSLFDRSWTFPLDIYLRQGSLSYQKTWVMLEHILSDQNVTRP
uniref:Uncharacterized protein n=1 Tax=Brassica oleracea var. oleracea TaxID=109376 RepID=A0A0D3BHK3_BRAOL